MRKSLNSTCSFIELLLRAGSPSAIRWCVITIIIYSVYRMLRSWPSSHILDKIGEFQPSFTNLYSSLSIIFILYRLRIFTSCSHCIPNKVFWPMLAANSCSMSKIPFYSQFPFKASTAFGMTRLKILGLDSYQLTALTNALPCSFPAFRCWSSLYYAKSIELLSREIYKFTHLLDSTTINPQEQVN